MKRIPLVSVGLKKRLWAIIVLVVAYLVYISLGDLIPGYWNWVGFRSLSRSILTLGFLIILLISLSGLAAGERLAILAIRDGPTGLYNHSYIKARLQEELYRSSRYTYPVSLLMIQLDDFKSLTDRYGHVAGDRFLRGFGDLIQEICRASDIAGRYGSEEFLIVMPQTGCLDAAAAAERIRREVGLRPLRIGSVDDQNASGTVTIGVTSSPEGELRVEEVINMADAALDRAKTEGKNKVVVYVR
jgi:diguanylate cyclase (GGDEF)-like protein